MHKLRFLFVLAGFALASCVVSQVVPQKVGETFRVSDDLEIALWASEPLLTNPTCIDVDHLGRVWVCESVNYRTKLHNKPVNRAAGDRIVILSDPKGVGRAEEAITFYQSPDLQAPLGIAVAKDPVGPGWKVYVCHSPDLLLFEDKDGDGKADGPPTKLLSGFKGFDHDHGLHGVSIGPDGKLYFSVGDQGVAGLVDKDGKTWRTNNSDCRAGTIWRCDLDGRNLEFLAHNFRNQYEPCVDSFGTIFVSDNDDDGNQQTRICLVMPGGNYGYHPRGKGESHWHEEQPGVVPLILRTGFGSPTGMCVYEGYQLPARFRGRLLHTDAGPRHVRLYTPRVSGAGYSLEREDIVQSTDTWFRPSDVCVAPDGSVFIADWYDPGVGGHGMGDIQRGRIYRLTAKGIGQPKTPPVDLETPEGLRRALASPALAVRHMAMAKLQAMAPKAAAALLEEIATATDNPVLRARALWQLARLGRLRPLAIAFRDPDPRFRILTIRALKEFQNVSPADYTDDWQTALLMDTPEVRREALLALRDVEAARAKPILLKLAKRHDGKDRFYVAAVGIAVGTDGKRREALLGTFNTDFPEWDDVTAHLAWELRPPAVLPRLEQLVTAPKITPRQRLQAIQTLAAFDGVEGGRALLRGLASPLSLDMREVILDEGRRLLPGKWAPLKKAPELNQAVEALWANAETRRLALSLIGIAEKSDALSRVVGVVQNAGQPFDLRVAAIHCLGQLPDAAAVKALTDLLPSAPDPLRTAIITALGAQAGGAANRPPTIPALQALQALVQNKETPPGLGQAAVAALAGTRAGAEWLIYAQVRRQLPPHLLADAGRLLRNTTYQDLRVRAATVFPPPPKIDPKKVPSPASLAQRIGNAAHGRELLAASLRNDLQCLKCHTIHGLGGSIGPDLSVIGKKASRENLFESILQPSKAVADQYVNWQVATSKGLVLNGLLVEETPDSLTLRDANGKDTRIDKSDIEARAKLPTSLMPDNLLAFMTVDDLVDIVEYLFSLKTPSTPVLQWHLAAPVRPKPATVPIDSVDIPERHINLQSVFHAKSPNPVTWRPAQATAQGFVDVRPFLGTNNATSLVYAQAHIESPEAQPGAILFSASTPCKIFVNDDLVYTRREARPAVPCEESILVSWKKGRNVVMVKLAVEPGSTSEGFFLRGLAERELKAIFVTPKAP